MSHRLEISVDGRIIYCHDVEEYSLEFDRSDLTLAAKHDLPRDPSLPTVTVNDGPPIDPATVISSVAPGEGIQLDPPPLTPGAPDGHDEDTEPADEVIETVHTGDRDPEAEEAAAKERRHRGRKPADTVEGEHSGE